MRNCHGIIHAYNASPSLRELTERRTSSSLPFAARYRLIDFPLSFMVNAGIRDVGVIMQRDYQSLLDHLGSGKDWDLSRRSGGLKQLPPFGLADSHMGEYQGTMEALTAVSSYIENIPQETVVMSRGDIVTNINLSKVLEQHSASGAEITAVCTKTVPANVHHRFVAGGDNFATSLLCRRRGDDIGLASMEIYVINKERLLKLMSYCVAFNKKHFHRDALIDYLDTGGKVYVYEHKGYAAHISSVRDYYKVSMDMFDSRTRNELFDPQNPIRTKERSVVSTYYGPHAHSKNCLVADGCYIEGEIENCILFRGVRIEREAKLKNCVIMQDTIVGSNSRLSYIICDKDVVVSRDTVLSGNSRLLITVPKGDVV